MFTQAQYQTAIDALHAGMNQLEPDGADCSICGDSGHQAWECIHNPLKAMTLSARLDRQARGLHETLHQICGMTPPYLGMTTIDPMPEA